MKLKGCLNIIAMGKAPQSLGFSQCGATAVAPTSLGHGFVPNLDVLLARSATTLKAPSQDLLVRASGKHTLGKFFVACLSRTYLRSDACRREWEEWCRHELEHGLVGQGAASLWFVKLEDLGWPQPLHQAEALRP